MELKKANMRAAIKTPVASAPLTTNPLEGFDGAFTTQTAHAVANKKTVHARTWEYANPAVAGSVPPNAFLALAYEIQ